MLIEYYDCLVVFDYYVWVLRGVAEVSLAYYHGVPIGSSADRRNRVRGKMKRAPAPIGGTVTGWSTGA